MSLSTDLSQCFGYTYNDEGHIFYVLTNPVDDWTFVYDISTQMWHERSTSNLADNNTHRHLGNCYVRFDNKHLVGDVNTGTLYEMSSKFYTDAGLPITSEQVTQRLFDDDQLEDVFIGELQIDIEAGVGDSDVNSPASGVFALVAGGQVTSCVVGYGGADYITTPQVIFQNTDGTGVGADATAQIQAGSVISITMTSGGAGYTTPPTVILAVSEVIPSAGLSMSKDGGKTWGGEHIRSMGKIGEHRKRMIWRGLGRAKDQVFKLRISDPVKKIILGYYVEPS